MIIRSKPDDTPTSPFHFHQIQFRTRSKTPGARDARGTEAESRSEQQCQSVPFCKSIILPSDPQIILNSVLTISRRLLLKCTVQSSARQLAASRNRHDATTGTMPRGSEATDPTVTSATGHLIWRFCVSRRSLPLFYGMQLGPIGGILPAHVPYQDMMGLRGTCISSISNTPGSCPVYF